MLLYDYFRSSCAYRVRIALNLKGVAYERRAIDLRANVQQSPDYRAHNPQGLVPALVVGELVLTQSLAIIEWLDARFPEPRLIPAEPTARAQTMVRALTIACDIQPLNNLRTLRRLGSQLGADEYARDRWAQHWIDQGFSALERGAGPGPFLGGDTPDIADVCLVPQMFNARRVGLALDAYPRLLRADAAMAGLDAVAAAHPDRVATDDG